MDKMLKVIIIGFMIYLLASNANVRDTIESTTKTAKNATSLITNEPDVPDEEVHGSFLEKSLSKIAINVLKTPEGRAFFEKIITPMGMQADHQDLTTEVNQINFIPKLFQVQTLNDSNTNEIAVCGHSVYVHYDITSPDGVIFEEFTTDTIHLGGRSVIPALENALVGIKNGQGITALSSSVYAYDGKKFRRDDVKVGQSIKIKARITDIIPKFFIKPWEVKIFDDVAAYKIPILCGDEVGFHVKITKFDGTVIYHSRQHNKGNQLRMRVGNNVYPMIFSHALHGKIPVGTRTVICKGKYFQSFLSKKINVIFPKALPEPEEFFMVEFSDFSTLR